MIGKTLVHYEITAEIGKGGMGEVYQAKDTKLGRNVAIKVLPEEFALDTDRVARFQREAKLLASLNHPNIAAIYGMEESEGTHFLVMELIEGDTLGDRIKSGPIPVEEALKLALQMAEALEAAHENGVIHRDLKPANIKVTPDGKVKILDFGLAKAYVGDQENMSPMDSPTISAAATQQGVILGTAAYMSPEQARGETVDRKADIWAFGVVLFEMLAGRQVFMGRTVSDTLASVLAREPEWNGLPANLHSRIRFLLERCLEKEANDRYSGIIDTRVEIQKVLADPNGVISHTSQTAKPRKKLRMGIPWIAATIAITAIIVGLFIWNLKPPEPHRLMRFDYHLPKDQQFAINQFGSAPLAVAPDGSHFLYGTPEGFYIRSVDQLDARPMPETDLLPAAPFFSSDGKWIGYLSVSDMKLKKVAISGGAPIALCDTPNFTGAMWNTDNTIIYGRADQGIMRVSAEGGNPETLLEIKGDIVGIPQILPDGESVIFEQVEGGEGKIFVQSLEEGEPRELIEGQDARYLPTGHLVYSLGYNLFAAPFDIDTLELTGGPVSMVEDVWLYSISDEGTLVYVPGSFITGGGADRTLVWLYRDGKEEIIPAPPNDYGGPKISPDGKWVALGIQTGQNEDIWIWDLIRENLAKLTLDEADDEAPLWTLDGKRIVFTSDRDGDTGLYWMAADGAGEVEPITTGLNKDFVPSSWSSDGNTLIITAPLGGFDISILSMEGEGEIGPLLQKDYHERQPQISPDGLWIAYSSNESGEYEIYVRSFPKVNTRRIAVSTSGGTSPLWSPDGKELFYRNGDSVMAVAVETEPNLSFGTPKKLFAGTYSAPLDPDFSQQTMWDIHPDGKRFLMIKDVKSDASTSDNPRKINIVLNWFEELKQKVPVD